MSSEQDVSYVQQYIKLYRHERRMDQSGNDFWLQLLKKNMEILNDEQFN